MALSDGSFQIILFVLEISSMQVTGVRYEENKPN
jgi:hypothetical protein